LLSIKKIINMRKYIHEKWKICENIKSQLILNLTFVEVINQTNFTSCYYKIHDMGCYYKIHDMGWDKKLVEINL